MMIRPSPPQCPVRPLSASQLSTALFALCHGLPLASRRYHTSPLTIQSWIRHQERLLSDKKWHWKTAKVAQWVLSQREQQLSVREDDLLQTARRALGEDAQPMDRYNWTVDFMLRHELSLQPTNTDDHQHHRGRLPRTIRENSRSFIHSLSAQVRGQSTALQ